MTEYLLAEIQILKYKLNKIRDYVINTKVLDKEEIINLIDRLEYISTKEN